MSEIKLSPGQLQPIILTDYGCSWRNEIHLELTESYDLGVEILEVTVDNAGRKKLSGKVKTSCAICGHVHEAMRQYCEIEFENIPCPKGHRSWKASVTNINRSSRDSSYDNVTYTFDVELYCNDCEKLLSRITQSILGTLASIKKIKIGLKGIEIERT